MSVYTVSQLGIFLRVLRPAELPCALPDLDSALPELKKKKKITFPFLCFQAADELYNACRFVPMFSSIAHKIVPRSCFVRVLDCARILGVRM